ncbi:DNA polymerase-3 subunit epsilon [Pustulibacterium marinum]|uniref:DNA polymerase-3 subunit epsilon n=1 Tax=Pustulibacterium marinum TaxID=1224947 RepID=A0A1I7GET3_9FLAO|nr:exonuclease domain-containing protein [Pustulibacterium marinum]SFU46776.1 DNA polymerase-3 subunit epsilon [Pustulibacterium marinum]
MKYTIIDIETTGASNKITEISIFKLEDDVVIDEFTSLVNPQTYIPDYITALTGIDNGMVADAPTFAAIANDVQRITEASVFVAHNVNFDYNIIRQEFSALGITFNRRKLCTIRLSRKLIPGLRSYSLGKLCASVGIPISDRHRARGDAEATVLLFQQLYQQEHGPGVIADFLKRTSKEATLPSHLPSSVFEKIPHQPGIYYFKNKKGKIIYVGKAKDLKKRVLGHFYDKSDKELTLCRETASIDYELSGSELVALLMEDAAIKQHFPIYNSAGKRKPKAFGIYTFEDRKGIQHLAYNTLKQATGSLITFYSIHDCRSFLEQLCNQFELCPKYCHLQENIAACSHFKLQHCHGICRDEEAVDAYNERVFKAIAYIHDSAFNKVIKKPGRHADEEAFVLIKDGLYRGYGFVGKEHQLMHAEDLELFLIPQQDTVDTQKILRKLLLID